MEAVLAGHECDAGGRAEWHGVEGFEAGAVSGEPIEVGGQVLGAAVAAEFFGAEVICEDEDDVGAVVGDEERGEEEEEREHGWELGG